VLHFTRWFACKQTEQSCIHLLLPSSVILIFAAFFLRFQQTSEVVVHCPSTSVALRFSHFYENLGLIDAESMQINPNRVVDDLPNLAISIFVSLLFRHPSCRPPVPVHVSLSMFLQRAGSHCQQRRIRVANELLHRQNRVQSVEVLNQKAVVRGQVTVLTRDGVPDT